jgi:phage terminase large subunit-like protein
MTPEQRKAAETQVAGIALPSKEEIEAEIKRRRRRKIDSIFPVTGPYRRQLLSKHMEFFAMGKSHLERAAIAANRSGKTTMVAYETTCHLTGEYPSWWKGHKFTHPILAWVVSPTAKVSREVMEQELCGNAASRGEGMIPGDSLIELKPRSGVPGSIDTAYVKHKSGGVSKIVFLSADAGREAFQGTQIDLLVFDEEPTVTGVVDECRMRLMYTDTRKCKPRALYSFTPLNGMTELVSEFLEPKPESLNDRWYTQIGWDDVPWLSEEEKTRMLSILQPHQIEARRRGTPTLGEGLVYNFLEDFYTVEPFQIPAHWRICAGYDFGWNNNACIWLAHDPDNDVVYAWGEYLGQQAAPIVHATVIKSRGEWIPIACDPAGQGSSQVDGQKLIDIYESHGLDLHAADNSVEAGIAVVYERLTLGKLKIFKTCSGLLKEFRVYRREKGKIVKKNDHHLDALRYGTVTGLDFAKSRLQYEVSQREQTEWYQQQGNPDIYFGGGGFIG